VPVKALLERATEAVSAGRFDAALPPLLEAYGLTRDVRVAGAVEAVGARVAPRPLIRGRNAQPRWMAAEKQADPADVARQLATVADADPPDASARVAALGKRPADPRIAAALGALLETPPFRSPSAKPFYERIFTVLSKIGDARQATALGKLTHEVFGVRTLRAWMQEETARLIADLKRPKVTPVDDETLGPLLEAMAMRDQTQGRDASRTGALLADVYASPDDDAPRSVLADHLLETGDPRGELIRLQLETPGTARERKLLAEHGLAWSGLAGQVLKDGLGYERGFVSAARQALRSRLVETPAWSTVKRLEVQPWFDTPQVLTAPCMRSLREVTGLPDALETLALAPGPLALVRLGFRHRFTAVQERSFVRSLVAAAPVLPSLRTLDVGTTFGDPASFEPLWKALALDTFKLHLQGSGEKWLSMKLPFRTLHLQAYTMIYERSVDGPLVLEPGENALLTGLPQQALERAGSVHLRWSAGVREDQRKIFARFLRGRGLKVTEEET
jgi:uncharacterized protein (TIGR02996 family)